MKKTTAKPGNAVAVVAVVAVAAVRARRRVAVEAAIGTETIVGIAIVTISYPAIVATGHLAPNVQAKATMTAKNARVAHVPANRDDEPARESRRGKTRSAD